MSFESAEMMELSIVVTLFHHPEQIALTRTIVAPSDLKTALYRNGLSAMYQVHDQGGKITEPSVRMAMGEQADAFIDTVNDQIQWRSTQSLKDFVDAIHARKTADTARSIMQEKSQLITSDLSVDEVMEITQKMGADISRQASIAGSSMSETPELIEQFTDDLLIRSECEGSITGLSTGIPELDEMTNGFEPGNIIVVGGRPGMGKSALALNFAKAALNQGKAAFVSSMEMPKVQVMRRFFAAQGNINTGNLKRANLTPLEGESLKSTIEYIRENWKLTVIDEGAMTIMAMRNAIYQAHYQSPLGIAVIDYIQLMSLVGAGSPQDSASFRIGIISQEFKRIALDLGIPIVVLSQLSREVDRRQDKRPVPSDLREAGAIEQDADMILFAYRDEEYNPDTMDKGIGEIIVAKQREGELGTVRTRFEGQYSRFTPMKVPQMGNAVAPSSEEMSEANQSALPASMQEEALENDYF